MTLPNWRNAAGTLNPNLWTTHDGLYQKGALIQLNWDVLVFKRSLATGQIVETFNLSSVPALVAYGITPILDDVSGDVHYAIAGMDDDQGRTWLGGNSLSTAGHQIYSAPNSISSWTTLTWPFPGMPQSAGVSLTGANQITYHNYNRLSDGRVLWLVSQRDPSGAAEGIDYIGFILPLGTTAWSPLVGNGEILTSEVADPERIYLGSIFVEQYPHPDRVWLWGTFRHVWTDVTTQRDAWIIYNDTVTNPATWKRIDGSSQPMPFNWVNGNGTSAMIPLVSGSYWYASGQMTIDRSGHPHLIHEGRPSSGTRHVWWDGAAWQDEACPTSSSSPGVFTLRNGNVLMYREFGGRIVISKVSSGAGPYFECGNPVPTNFDGLFNDPIQASKGYLHVLLADGDTPQVCTFGDNVARARAS